MFSHVVIFWTDPAQPGATDQLAAGAEKYLRTIPGVKQFHVGRMVPSHRPVVDQSYQVALNIVFTPTRRPRTNTRIIRRMYNSWKRFSNRSARRWWFMIFSRFAEVTKKLALTDPLYQEREKGSNSRIGLIARPFVSAIEGNDAYNGYPRG